MSQQFKQNYFGGETRSVAEIEAAYWRIVEQGSKPVEVEYGNDICSADWGSGFEFLADATFSDEGDDDKRFRHSRKADAEETSRLYNGCQSWNLNLIPRRSILGHLTSVVSVRTHHTTLHNAAP